MKTISTLLTSFFLTTSIFAAGVRSTATLTVKSVNKADIVVVVDDKRYDLGTHSIMISDLDACNHEVTVYQENNSGSVNCSEKTYDVLFNSSVELKPRTNLEITIDDCGIITMNETKFRTPGFGDTWKGSNYYNENGFDNNNAYSKAISEIDFSRVVWAISKESSETNRMRSAEQIINMNYLTVDEVKQLMQLFCSDDNKLDVAKLAYDKTVDQDDYYTLNNVFKFDNSRDELARCIRK
ncbi:MAG: DUF4476 domain-containing protein [Chitinophagales bacterium]